MLRKSRPLKGTGKAPKLAQATVIFVAFAVSQKRLEKAKNKGGIS
jgi:hypothetical protein